MLTPRDLRFREASSTDIDALMQLASASKQAPHWSRAIWESMLTPRDDAAARAVFLAESARDLRGFVVVSAAGDAAELESIAVAQTARRQGIGRTLLAHATRWAASHGALRIELEVRASNQAARALYQEAGFTEQGLRRRYYRDPVEDAVLLAKALTEGVTTDLSRSAPRP